jgi:hypothetical protein
MIRRLRGARLPVPDLRGIEPTWRGGAFGMASERQKEIKRRRKRREKRLKARIREARKLQKKKRA